MLEIYTIFKDRMALVLWIFPVGLLFLFVFRIWRGTSHKQRPSRFSWAILLIPLVCLIGIGLFIYKDGERKSKKIDSEFALNIDSIPVISADIWTKIMFKNMDYLEQIASNRGFNKAITNSYAENHTWIRFDFKNPEWTKGDNLHVPDLEEIFAKDEIIDTVFYCIHSKESYYNFFTDLESKNVIKARNGDDTHYLYKRCFFIRQGYKRNYGNVVAIVTE